MHFKFLFIIATFLMFSNCYSQLDSLLPQYLELKLNQIEKYQICNPNKIDSIISGLKSDNKTKHIIENKTLLRILEEDSMMTNNLEDYYSRAMYILYYAKPNDSIRWIFTTHKIYDIYIVKLFICNATSNKKMGSIILCTHKQGAFEICSRICTDSTIEQMVFTKVTPKVYPMPQPSHKGHHQFWLYHTNIKISNSGTINREKDFGYKTLELTNGELNNINILPHLFFQCELPH